MAHLNIYDLDDQVLAELKRRAAASNVSVNALVLQLLDQALGRASHLPTPQRRGDLDALAGCWSAAEAQAFDAATAPFGRVQSSLWKP